MIFEVPPSLHIRPMRTTDLDAVMAIEVVACPAPWTRTGYDHELRHNKLATYFVLEKENRVIGYVGHWIMADEGHISIIAVDPKVQGNGYGELLLHISLNDMLAKNAILATLEVREHNLPAQGLYNKLGFKRMGRRKKYYKDSGEDAFIMTIEPLDDAFRTQLRLAWTKLLSRFKDG